MNTGLTDRDHRFILETAQTVIDNARPNDMDEVLITAVAARLVAAEIPHARVEAVSALESLLDRELDPGDFLRRKVALARRRTAEEKPKVKLVGQDGNAFAILGTCQRQAKAAGWPKQEIEWVLSEMKAGDYNHLLHTATVFFDVT